MEPVEKQNSLEELSDVTKTEAPTDDTEGNSKEEEEEEDSSSPCSAEIESQAFQLRAEAFRRDLASLESRLEQEERSRDQAEEHVKAQVSSSQALLQTLVPLCEHNNQTLELIQKLQKALDMVPLAMMRMSTRSETLGVIKEEKRVTQDVEAMLEHVENLRRICNTGHTELAELRESLEEEEEEDKPAPENDDFSSQQAAGSPYYMLWGQGDLEVDLAGLNRRNTWRGAGRSAMQPALHRLISSSARMQFNESSLMKREQELPPVEEEEEEEKLSRLRRLRNRLAAFVRAVRTREHPVVHMIRSFPAMVRDRSSWEWWTPLVLAVLLASLLALLGTLTFRPAVETAGRVRRGSR